MVLDGDIIGTDVWAGGTVLFLLSLQPALWIGLCICSARTRTPQMDHWWGSSSVLVSETLHCSQGGHQAWLSVVQCSLLVHANSDQYLVGLWWKIRQRLVVPYMA